MTLEEKYDEYGRDQGGEYDSPVRVAFCKILFAKNGGRFTDTGLPITNEGARGQCDRAYDCISCVYLEEWVQLLANDGWEIGWECDACLKNTDEHDDMTGVERRVQGFYQAGRPPEDPPSSEDYDPDRPALSGCTRCGWGTSFLQLVLRRS